MHSIYLAGPVFSEAEISWLGYLKSYLGEQFTDKATVFWPFEVTPKDSVDRAAEVLRICRSGLENADIVVASLDGPQVDDGTAWEIGYFYNKNGGGDRIVGIRTDFRRAGETAGVPVNTLVGASCGAIVQSLRGLAEHLADVLIS
jgi:nucleoside 2-deoxyribosyltransferase